MADLSDMRKRYHLWPSERAGGFDAWDVDRLIDLTESLPIEEIDVESIDEMTRSTGSTTYDSPRCGP